MSNGHGTTPQGSRDPPADQLALDLTTNEDETFADFMERMRDPAENPQLRGQPSPQTHKPASTA